MGTLTDVSSDEVVVRGGEDDAGLKGLGFLQLHVGIGHDDHDIAHLYLACGSTVEADAAARARSFNNLSVETLDIHVVHDVDALSGDEPGSVHQILVDGDAAHVVEVSLGDGGTMNLGFQNFYHHGCYILKPLDNCDYL